MPVKCRHDAPPHVLGAFGSQSKTSDWKLQVGLHVDEADEPTSGRQQRGMAAGRLFAPRVFERPKSITFTSARPSAGADVQDTRDVLALQLRGAPGFEQEALDGLLVLQRRGKHELDRDRLSEVQVRRRPARHRRCHIDPDWVSSHEEPSGCLACCVQLARPPAPGKSGARSCGQVHWPASFCLSQVFPHLS